jgi:hypothetical protein
MKIPENARLSDLYPDFHNGWADAIRCGRIATLPELALARTTALPPHGPERPWGHSPLWDNSITTSSYLLLGRRADGEVIVAFAHGHEPPKETEDDWFVFSEETWERLSAPSLTLDDFAAAANKDGLLRGSDAVGNQIFRAVFAESLAAYVAAASASGAEYLLHTVENTGRFDLTTEDNRERLRNPPILSVHPNAYWMSQYPPKVPARGALGRPICLEYLRKETDGNFWPIGKIRVSDVSPVKPETPCQFLVT